MSYIEKCRAGTVSACEFLAKSDTIVVLLAAAAAIGTVLVLIELFAAIRRWRNPYL